MDEKGEESGGPRLNIDGEPFVDEDLGVTCYRLWQDNRVTARIYGENIMDASWEIRAYQRLGEHRVAVWPCDKQFRCYLLEGDLLENYKGLFWRWTGTQFELAKPPHL